MMMSRLKISTWIVLMLLATLSQGQDTINKGQVKAIDSLLLLARQAAGQGDFLEAGSMARQALELSQKAEYRHGKAESYYLLGRAAEAQGDPPQALRHYYSALREFEWGGEKERQADTYTRLGDIFRAGGLLSKASENYSKALQLFGSGAFANELADLKQKLAATYYLSANYDSALVIYKEIYSQAVHEDPGLAFTALLQAISCQYSLGRYLDALADNLKALDLAKSLEDDPTAMIQALNSQGYTFQYLGEIIQAEDAFRKAYEMASTALPGSETAIVTLVNLAVAQQNAGEIQTSLQSFFKAMEMAEKQQYKDEYGRITHLVSYVYFLQKDYYNASVYNKKAIAEASASGDAELLQNAWLVASMISTSLYDYEQGMDYYRKYLSLRDSLDTRDALVRQELSQQEYTVERTEKELSQILYEREIQGMEVKNLRIEGEKKQQELELLRKTADLQTITIQNQQLEKNRALQELLLAEERLAAEKKDREIKDLKVQQQLQESELKRQELEQIRQQQEIQVLTKDKELKELAYQKVKARNIFMAGIILLGFVILVLMIVWLRYMKRTNLTLHNQRNKIQQQKEALESQYEVIVEERAKSEKLLLNILPEETAAELKETGKAVPRHYEKVSVLFTDFVGFTHVAEKMTPEELIGELDLCFMNFDRIIENHGLEKIKTIGDAYMCAGGIPVANDTNPFDAVAAAMEIREFMDRTREERKREGKEYWQCRIGIHTGKVVAGVVGKMKFAYDIWGDAVNTASRMESSGEPNRVNISGSTYLFIKEKYHCVYRGKVYAKNKGEIDMYFVESLAQQLP